jgi:outer membrane protein TolC
MTLTTATMVALLLGQTPAAGEGATAPATPSAEQAPVLPADATGPVITLDEALQVAGERSLDLQVLSAQLDQAQEITWKALSLYLPQVSVGASWTKQDEVRSPVGFGFGAPVALPPQVQSQLPAGTKVYDQVGIFNVEQQKDGLIGVQANATQTLFSARLFFAIRGSKDTQRVVTLNVENGRRQVLFGVARVYYAAAALKETLGVTQRLLEIAQRQEHDAQVRFNAGAIAKVGLIRAQIDRARAEEDVKRSRASYLSAKVGLAALLARDTAFEVAAPPEPALPSADLDALVSEGLQARPDIQASKITVSAEEENRKSQVSRYLPDVQLFGRYQWANQEGLNGKHGAWYGGVQLQWILLDGLRRESDIREADGRIAEAKARAEGAVVGLRRDVTQALLDLESARSNAQKSREQRDLAAENQRLVDVAYKAGTATAVEQADATAQLRNAEIQVTTDTLNAQLAALQVLNTIGSFNPRKP